MGGVVLGPPLGVELLAGGQVSALTSSDR
jgi:hypothetical protein